MKMHRIFFASMLAAILIGVSTSTEVEAMQKSSKPSSSGSSKPAPSKPTPAPSKPTPPPVSKPPADKPKFTSPTPPSKPADKPADKPKFTSPSTPSTPKVEDKPKFTSPDNKAPVVGSSKPKASPNDPSDKARANKEERSERKFVETTKAAAPPKAKYTTPDGKEVQVRTATKDVEKIRNMPSSSIKPEVRQQNINVHVTKYNYPHPYSYYQSQPYVYMGAGYSSALFWMMTDWDAERRARWYYNHEHELSADAYRRGVADAQTAQAIARLKEKRSYQDPNYTDPEFDDNPATQYTDEYVEAAYNPQVHPSSGTTDTGTAWNVLIVLGCIVLGGLVLWGLYVLLFKARWGS